ncbi:hypothetical protein SAMN05216480_10521 [Pustulibacterium marinum]|uniref:Uncharacterized protein n=1 Tax=Pustulibacterium marinum TaxID=1224947 RepID=A0A1I7GK69_9FLAO|nr:hypothetical protein [Pustulibacterium marinum]SFU48835.1 hypothetical protein SAMN05216480_10521 [Pustulibacterium marinum]
MPTVVFPLSIVDKEDHPELVEQFQGVDPKYYYSAAEWNLLRNAINALHTMISTGNSKYLGDFTTTDALIAAYPDPEPGSRANIVNLEANDDLALWDENDEQWFIFEGAGGFGTVDAELSTESTNPLQNAAITEALLLLTPAPDYDAPMANLTSVTQTVEMGTSLANLTFNITYYQYDGGPATGYKLLRNGVEISTVQNNTISEDNITEVIQFQGAVAHNVGEVQNNILGLPDSTGLIQAGTVYSVFRTITPKYKAFMGMADAIPSTPAAARALPYSSWADNDSISFVTDQEATQFYVVIPAGRVITLVEDLSNLGADITSTYVLVDAAFTMEDNGGNEYTAKLYERTQAVPYDEYATHKITLGNA